MSVKYFSKEQNKWVIFPGTVGLPGKEGKKGKDAYEIAKENGFEGTREEYTEMLKKVSTISIVDLVALKNKVDQNTNNINANTTKINNHTTTINNHTTNINNIKNSLSDISNIVYGQHSSISLSVRPSVFETGVSTSVTVTASIVLNNKQITPFSLEFKKGNSVISNSTSFKTYSDTITSTTTYSLKTEILEDIVKTATATATSYYPIYYGASASATITVNDILYWGTTGQKKIQGNSLGTYTINVTNSNGEHVWFCVPNGYSIREITLNGFGAPVKTEIKTIDVPNKTSYKCYSLDGLYAKGTYNFVVTKV